MADKEKSDWRGTLLGLAIILFVLGIFGYTGWAAYKKLITPIPVVISSSAYFVDESGKPVYDQDSPGYDHSHLKIRGTAAQGEQPIKSGTALVTVATSNDLFRQSVSVPLIDGKFETEDPTFFVIRPGEVVEIRVEVTAKGIAQTSVIHLNTESPVDKTALEYGLVAVLVLLGIVFLLAFTGKKSAWRNQTAIIFSYVIIALFLAVPIIGPVLLIRTFPKVIDAMIGEPAGLVNTHTPNQQEGETQWALNIGGYSYKKPETLTAANGEEKPSEKPIAPAITTTKPGSTGAPNSSMAGGNANRPGAPTALGTQNGSRDAKLGQSVSGRALASAPQGGELKPPIVVVQGGLVIPLYVIILSVIGGAINMTRKVPGFQKEGEESDITVGHPISNLGSRALQIAGLRAPKPDASASAPAPASEAEEQAPAPTIPETNAPADIGTSLEEQATAIEEALGKLLPEQLIRNCQTDRALADIRALVSTMQGLFSSRKADEPLLKFSSFADWAASHPKLAELLRGSWRVELLNQYMYLISAPFLAIVTYYILDLLGLSKQGVVVVLSFSVGLVSEKIVSWILGIAAGYMQTDAKKT